MFVFPSKTNNSFKFKQLDFCNHRFLGALQHRVFWPFQLMAHRHKFLERKFKPFINQGLEYLSRTSSSDLIIYVAWYRLPNLIQYVRIEQFFLCTAQKGASNSEFLDPSEVRLTQRRIIRESVKMSADLIQFREETCGNHILGLLHKNFY